MSDAWSINPDTYLNRLAPKPVKIKTSQQVFDHVVKTLWKQRVPCIRIDDATGEMEPVTFNTSGLISPLLMFFNDNDLSYLKKNIGYKELQYFDYVDIKTYLINRPIVTGEGHELPVLISDSEEEFKLMSETDKENCRKLIDLFELRGLNVSTILELCILERGHLEWFYSLDFSKFTTQTNHLDSADCTYRFLTKFHTIAYNLSFNEDVLNVVKP